MQPNVREDTIVAFRPWTELAAWSAAALGALVAALGAATSHVVPWWAIEAAALVALVGGATGITLACRREVALRRASEMLGRAQAHLPGVLFEADADGVISWMSANAIEVLGQPAHTLVGRTLREIVADALPGPDAATEEAALPQSIALPIALPADWRAADGTSVHHIAEIESIPHDPDE